MCFNFFFAKAKRFYFFKNILEQNQNFLMCHNFFFSKSKTLLYNPEILDLKENVLVRY